MIKGSWRSTGACAVVAVVLVLSSAPIALAGEGSLPSSHTGVKISDDLTGDIRSGTDAVGSKLGLELDPTEDDDSPGHETEDPTGPDHAGGALVEASVEGNELVTVGKTESRIDNDGRSSGDVTVLAIGGQEIIGAHSDSRGQGDDSVDPFAQLCEGSGGGVCLGLLFADTSSRENENSSSSESNSSLAYACLGGSDEDGAGTCSGPVGAQAGESHSEITRDSSSGRTQASQRTEVANVCLGQGLQEQRTQNQGEGQGRICSFGVSLIRSDSNSDAPSDESDGTTNRDSHLLGVQGEEVITDPVVIAVPADCPPGESLICVFFNQGESFVSQGRGASRQEAVHVTAFPGGKGADLVLGHFVTAESLVHNPGPAALPDEGGPVPGGPEVLAERDATAPATEGSSLLPFTGGNLLGLLFAAAGCVLAGWGVLELRKRTRSA